MKLAKISTAKSTIGTLLLILAAPLAHASVSCSGNVTYLGIDQIGNVIVSNGTGLHSICNSGPGAGFQINPQACRMFYASLLANRIAGKSVTIYYNDPNLTSCAQIGMWSTQPSAYFLEQAN